MLEICPDRQLDIDVLPDIFAENRANNSMTSVSKRHVWHTNKYWNRYYSTNIKRTTYECKNNIRIIDILKISILQVGINGPMSIRHTNMQRCFCRINGMWERSQKHTHAENVRSTTLGKHYHKVMIIKNNVLMVVALVWERLQNLRHIYIYILYIY